MYSYSYDFPLAEHFGQTEFDSFLLHAEALSFGLSTRRFERRIFLCRSAGTEGPELGLFWTGSDIVSPAGRELTVAKDLTNRVLRSAGLPVPEGRRFAPGQQKKAIAYASKLGWPVVVKPSNGTGGRAVTTGIESVAGIEKALKILKKNDGIIVERHMIGVDYRVLVVSGAVLAVTKREFAHVIGDGQHSILELIAATNAVRIRNPRFRSSLIKPMSALVAQVLERQHLTLESIPKHSQLVALATGYNISQGGSGADVTQETHPSILNAAIATQRAFPGVGQLGIDVIMEDHRKATTEQAFGICEVNSFPALSQHCFPSKGTDPDPGRYLTISRDLFAYFASRKGIALGAQSWAGRQQLDFVQQHASTAPEVWATGVAQELGLTILGVERHRNVTTLRLDGCLRKIASIACRAMLADSRLDCDVVQTRPL